MRSHFLPEITKRLAKMKYWVLIWPEETIAHFWRGFSVAYPPYID